MLKPMKQNRGFTLIELLIVITIIGILMSLITVSIAAIQKRSRDSKRKVDVAHMRSSLDLFKADFKIYPNFTFYLGSNTTDEGAKDSSFKLGDEIEQCTALPNGAPALFASNVEDLNNAVLLQGFDAVNSFLICLGYTESPLQDPLFPADTVDGYQYRVSFDYAEMIVSAQLENSNDPSLESLFGANNAKKRFIEGTGKISRQLADDSHLRFVAPPFGAGVGFYSNASLTSNTLDNGYYLYQCAVKASGETISKDESSASAYQPLIITLGVWAKNTACRDVDSGDLVVIRAYGRYTPSSGGGEGGGDEKDGG